MSVNISEIKKNLINTYSFLGGIIDNTRYFETPNCVVNGHPTGGTDGVTIFYHPDIDQLSLKKQEFLFAHEICHIALNHKERCGNRDKKIWNIATDAVINAQLKSDGFELIEGSIDYPWAKNKSAEEVYKILVKKDKNKKKKNKKRNKDENDNQNEEQTGHDDHSLWDENNDKIKTQNKISEKEIFKKDGDIEKKKEQIKEIVEYLKEKNKKEEKIKGEKGSTEIGVILPGDTTDTAKFKLEDIDTWVPLVNWPLYLKRPIEVVELEWTYQNASVEDGVVSSHLEEYPYSVKYKTEILLDTSGSVSDDLLRQFLRECKHILNFSEIKVGCFDIYFYGFNEIKSIQDINNMEFTGRGGTSFTAAVEAFSDDCDNKIIFTDGRADMPSKEIDAIWVVYGGHQIKPRGGRVIYIDTDKLQLLSMLNEKEKEAKPKILIR